MTMRASTSTATPSDVIAPSPVAEHPTYGQGLSSYNGPSVHTAELGWTADEEGGFTERWRPFLVTHRGRRGVDWNVNEQMIDSETKVTNLSGLPNSLKLKSLETYSNVHS